MVKRIGFGKVAGLFPLIGNKTAQGTISTIQKSASGFVKRRKQLGGPKSYIKKGKK